jgi:hypothetical protein
MKWALWGLGLVAVVGCGSSSTTPSVDGAIIRYDSASGKDSTADTASLDGGAKVCQTVTAGLDGGWQLARFAKSNITGRSGLVEITMGDWQCRTASTDWTQKDTTVACVDATGTSHALFLRSASFDPICGNQNSCAWIRLSDTQDMPSFAGSDKGVNGYWDTANYDGRSQIFQVGIIDAYQDNLFTGTEEAQDLYLSQSFSVCIQYGPAASSVDAGLTNDAGIDSALDTSVPDVSKSLDTDSGDGGASICQVVTADLDGGWQVARFARSSITGKSGIVEITMGDWQCRTASTDWTQKDTTVACVDATGTSHALFLRSASFDPICGNQNSCAWIRLSDTQDMPSFAGSDKGVNGYWDTANYDGRPQIFQVGIIDAYQDNLFTGTEEAQDLYLSQLFSICIQYAAAAPTVDGSVSSLHDASVPDANTADASVDAGRDAPSSPADRSPDLTPDALTCPVYLTSVGFCAGENDCAAGGSACACNGGNYCCIPGFCWTRYIAGCSQETCPPGAGRNYTNHCACPANTKEVYDPCRPGFLVSCDPT